MSVLFFFILGGFGRGIGGFGRLGRGFFGFLLNTLAERKDRKIGKTGYGRKRREIGNNGVTDIKLGEVFELFDTVERGDAGVFKRKLLELGKAFELAEALELGECNAADKLIKGKRIAHAICGIKLGVIAVVLHFANFGKVEGAKNAKVFEHEDILNVGNLCVNNNEGILSGLFFAVFNDVVGHILIAEHNNGVCIGCITVADSVVINEGFYLGDILFGDIANAVFTECFGKCFGKILIFKCLVGIVHVEKIIHYNENGACKKKNAENYADDYRSLLLGLNGVAHFNKSSGSIYD